MNIIMIGLLLIEALDRLRVCLNTYFIPFQLTFGYSNRSNNSGRLVEFIVYVAFSHARLLSAPEIFIPVEYGTKNRRRKPAPENGVDLWRRQFLERVSCVWDFWRASSPPQQEQQQDE